MKKTFLILVNLLFILNVVFSQDIMTKKNGEEIQCKVIEVTPDLVKYKKFNNLDGPIYSIPIKDIFMLKYENGGKDVFNDQNSEKSENDLRPLTYVYNVKIKDGNKKLSPNEIRSLYSCCNDALSKYISGKRSYTAGAIIGFPSAVVFGVSLGLAIAGAEPNTTILIVSGLGFLGGEILLIVGGSSV